MKVRRLDIIGFKSFAERSVLHFDDGVAGIVGPNGCGKSNIVDAVRWVMGEQSARALRGKIMEDVIFAGSETKPPMGMAEVRLVLENDGRNIPPEYAAYPEITVGRRLFRSGESEYSINRTPCRLIDVQELFMGTGVGTRAYSIISQGKIGMMVSQKPIERRAIVEEAAGISKYKARRRIAERKMEQTRHNLLRVNDVIQEIKRNIDALKRQARKAARYNKLREQLRQIELHAAAHRYLEFQAIKGYLTQKKDRLSLLESELQSTVASMEASVEQRRMRLLEEERRLAKVQEALLSTDNQIKLNEKNIEFLTREVDSLANRGQQAAKDIENLRAEVCALSAELNLSERKQEELKDISRTASLRLQEREKAYQSQQQQIEQLVTEIDRLRQFQLDLGGQAGELRSHTSTQHQRLVDLEGRLGQAEAEQAALRGRLAECTEKKRHQTEQLNHARQLHLDLVEKREVKESSLAELHSQAKENEARVAALREEIGLKRSRLESLREIERNYDGCFSGVRWVMRNANKHDETSEVLGLVADILQAPARYETAVQAVLGERLQSVVVRSQNAGLAAVDYLKRETEGRSSFIPLSLRDPITSPDLSGIQGPGVIGPMQTLLEYQEDYETVIRYLFGDVVVVEDLPTAMSVWSANGHQATLVTIEGDVLEPEGVLTGGSLESPSTHLLENKREARELEEKLRHLEAEYRLVQDRQGKLKLQIATAASAIESLRDHSHDEEIRIIDKQKDLAHLHEQLEGISQRLEKLGYEHEHLRAEMETCQREMERAHSSLAETSTRQQELDSRILADRNTIEQERRTLESLTQELLELKVQAASSQERHESACRNAEHLIRTRNELEQRIERLRSEITSGNLQNVQGRKRIEQNREEISNLLALREKQQQELKLLREAYEKLLAEVRQDEIQLKDRRHRQEQCSQELGDINAQLRETNLEMIHLSGDVHRSHREDIASCLSAYHLLPPPSEDQKGRSEKLRLTLERMGDVNPHAVQAYEELTQRYEFLNTQSKDLTDSLEKLQTVINKINRTSRKRFLEVFEAINQKFAEVFPRLFSGGNAYLALEDDQDLLEAGVTIVVRPPGKKLQNLELLSGGEKALTAVALLFAIFLVKPTPFCLLDEVDAPLDDANLDRFNTMVRDMAKSSQFIIITHNKRTMESIDKLYGITMEEPGISTVVSVRLRDQPDNHQLAV